MVIGGRAKGNRYRSFVGVGRAMLRAWQLVQWLWYA
jgi:hypothetical protein